jgi:hypothetical protein
VLDFPAVQIQLDREPQLVSLRPLLVGKSFEGDQTTLWAIVLN